MAISRCRAMPRAISSPATLAHAIRSTPITIAISVHSGRVTKSRRPECPCAAGTTFNDARMNSRFAYGEAVVKDGSLISSCRIARKKGCSAASARSGRHSRAQPRKHPREPAASVFHEIPARCHLGLHHHRDEHLRRVADVDAVKSLARDADDRERLAIQQNLSPDDPRVAIESAGPVIEAQDGHRVSAGHAIVGRRDDAAAGGADAENRKIRPGHELAIHPFRRAAPRQVHRPLEPGTHTRKHGVAVADVLVHRVRQLRAVAPRVAAERSRRSAAARADPAQGSATGAGRPDPAG